MVNQFPPTYCLALLTKFALSFPTGNVASNDTSN